MERALKEAVGRLLLKKSSMDLEYLTIIPVTNVPFLGEVIGWVGASQLHTHWDETGFLRSISIGVLAQFCMISCIKRELGGVYLQYYNLNSTVTLLKLHFDNI